MWQSRSPTWPGLVDKRREKVIARIKKSNIMTAVAIIRIPPSSQHMFPKVVELCMDLSATADRSFSDCTPVKGRSKGSGGGGGYSHAGHGKGRNISAGPAKRHNQ